MLNNFVTMKKTLFICAALALAIACTSKAKESVDVQAEMDRISETLKSVYEDPSLTETQKDSAFHTVILDEYNKHSDDSIGLEMFASLAAGFGEPEEVKALYENASELVRNDEGIKKNIEMIEVMSKTSVGARYIDVVGPDAVSGKTYSIAEALKLGKPVLVDFWASWCRPCRNEISTNLVPLAKKGAVTVLGIAVWEKDIEDTRKAMKDLGISWKVIYAGDRENSPTEKYGIQGIPTLILVGTDGKILGRGHSIEEIPYFNGK